MPIEITPYENSTYGEIDKLLPVLKEFGHRGPLNIQGRLTDQGLKLFEMNARFTDNRAQAIWGSMRLKAVLRTG